MAFDNQMPAAARNKCMGCGPWGCTLLLPSHMPLLTICDSSASTELSVEAVLGPGFSSCVGGVWVIRAGAWCCLRKA